LFRRERESLLEVVISPCINHPGSGRTKAFSTIPVRKKNFKNKEKRAVGASWCVDGVKL
jgi:hypothetical protein